MRLEFKSPAFVYLPDDGEDVKRFLSYRDRQIEFQISRMKKQVRYSQSDWAIQRIEELKTQINTTLLWHDDEGRAYTLSGLAELLHQRFRWQVIPYDFLIQGKSFPYLKAPKHKNRFYQDETVKALIEARHGAAELPTGSGKSNIIRDLAKHEAVQTVVLAPMAGVAEQLYLQFIELFGVKWVGMYGDGKKHVGKLITVGVAQSFVNMKEGTKEWEYFSKTKKVIFDECFPYKTQVLTSNGLMPIGKIYNQFLKGEKIYVQSWNESTKQFEYKLVTNAWNRGVKEKLISIKMNNKLIRCTHDHKLLTPDGWKEACKIQIGDKLISHKGNLKTQSSIAYSISNVDLVEEVDSVSLTNGKPIRNASNMTLYDLEVEDNHNFIVGGMDGIVAHNCHMVAADTFKSIMIGIMINAEQRYFLSATQLRTDGSELLLKGITGPVVYRKSFKELRDLGYLAHPRLRIFSVPTHGSANHSDAKVETRNQLYNNPHALKMAGEIATKMIQSGKQVIILIEEFRSFDVLKNYVSEFTFLHGGATKEHKDWLPPEFWEAKNIAEEVKKFNEGKTRCIIGTSAISTGTDFIPVGCLIYLQGGTSEIKVKQGIGRGTRVIPGVKNDFFVVDFRVVGSSTMERHLNERLEIYAELSDDITYH